VAAASDFICMPSESILSIEYLVQTASPTQLVTRPASRQELRKVVQLSAFPVHFQACFLTSCCMTQWFQSLTDWRLWSASFPHTCMHVPIYRHTQFFNNLSMKCAKEKHAMLEFHTIAKGTKTISKRIQAVVVSHGKQQLPRSSCSCKEVGTNKVVFSFIEPCVALARL